MIGVAPDHAGRSSFHVMFSVALHFTGSPVSRLTPSSVGPRHCGQFSAPADTAIRITNSIEMGKSVLRFHVTVSIVNRMWNRRQWMAGTLAAAAAAQTKRPSTLLE